MSRQYERRVTLTIDGDEADHFARAWVETGYERGAWFATLDGTPDVLINGEWWPADALALGPRDLDNLDEALCTAASEDDS